jgi:nucleotide-binding universal stress UspA family protein
VAVGSRGLGAVRRSLLGSLSDKLVRHARATLVAR